MDIFSAALLARYNSRCPLTLLLTLPCPEDITPIKPAGDTSGASVSMVRIGLSALVTMMWMNSSVDTSLIVCAGSRFAVPAL